MRWLICLFTTPPEAEAILGDLQEERSQVAARDGASGARRWYIRQSVRTVAHLAVAPVRQAPGHMAIFGIIGMAVTFPVNMTIHQLAMQLVVREPIYDYVPATVFWSLSQLAAPFLTGLAIAWIMRGRAMATAMAAVAAITVMVFLIDPLTLSFGAPERMLGPGFLIWRAFVLLGSYGGLLLMGTVIGVSLKRAVTPRVVAQG